MKKNINIRDIAKLNQETYTKNSLPVYIKYLDTGSLTKNKIESFQIFNTTTDKLPSRAQRKVRNNTILYSTIRPNQEHYGIIENDFDDLIVSTGFTTIDIIDKNIHPKFIYYLLIQNQITEHLHTIGMNAVSAYPTISPNDIGNLQFSLPSLPTQKSIAKVLSDLDAKIELNNKINKELEAMAKTLYDYWFVQFDFPNKEGKPYKSSGGKMVYNKEINRDIPEGWEVKKLGDIIKFQRGISYKSSEIINEGIHMINLNSFNLDGTYKNSGLKNFTGKYTENQIVKSGDLLIAATDVTRNADIIGKAIIVPSYYEKDIVFSMDIAKIIPKKNITSSFLMMLFNSNHYHNYIKWYASGTIVLHLNIDGIKWYKSEIPPIDLLKKFDEIYFYIANRINKTEKQNQELSSLRDWLLPMLMNGQVLVGN